METPNKLDYNFGNVGILPENHIRIQASSLARFFSRTSEWYDEKLCDAEGFQSNTSSVLGTCVHFYSEDFIKTGQVDTIEIEKYIRKFDSNDDVDTAYIRRQYPIMGEKLLNWLSLNPPTAVEEFISYELKPGIHIGGSVDNRTQLSSSNSSQSSIDTYEVVDYKTTGSLTAPSKISQEYRTQLLTYAAVYSTMGIKVTSGKIVYITHNQVNRRGKPSVKNPLGNLLPDRPSTITEIRFEITPEMIENFLNNTAHLIADSILLFMKHPEYRHIIGQHAKFKDCHKQFPLLNQELNPDEV